MRLHPSLHAVTNPEKAATILASTGESVTYRELEARSNRAAHLFRARGMRNGDCIAILMDNSARYFDIAWGAQRAGLYYVCISTKLSAVEADYILRDSGARLLAISASLAPLGDALRRLRPDLPMLAVDGDIEGFDSFENELALAQSVPIDDEASRGI